MGKEKGVIFIFVVLVALLFVFGAKKIRSLQAQIGEQKESLAKLDQRLDKVRSLEESLELRRMTGKVLHQIPRVQDPIANKVLIEKFVKSFLSRLGFEAEVKVENERPSKDFPDLIGVNEVPLRIGIINYSSYNQVMNMLEEFRNFPFAVEILTIGGTDVAVPGNLRVQLKYYVVPEVS
jgi:Sec-independent protein translocase protein TatA